MFAVEWESGTKWEAHDDIEKMRIMLDLFVKRMSPVSRAFILTMLEKQNARMMGN